MSYLDIVRKLNNHSDTTSAMLVQGKNLENMYFTKDPSYRRATLGGIDLVRYPLDIRIKNISRTTEEKKLILRPDCKVNLGSYIYFDEKTYLVMEYEDNSTSPFAKVEKCNNLLQIDKDTSFGITSSSDAYGSKGSANNDFLLSIDNKLKVEIQNNEITRQIMPDYRFILNHSPTDIFKIIDRKTSVKEGIIEWICKKDTYMEGYDDLENNLAYNGTSEPIPPAAYSLEGEDEIKINQTYQYKLFPTVGNAMWKLDDYTVMNNLAELSLVDAYTVEIKGLKQGEFIELICEIGGVTLKKEIMIVR